MVKIFQSTLLMRGATLYSGANARGVNISIHAPHARSDDVLALDCRPACDFNPRSSCEERHQDGATGYDIVVFQSTLLMRGATSVQPGRSRVHSNFNPRSSCEERLQIRHVARHVDIFQATLLMRGATTRFSISSIRSTFQSTLLMRGATSTGSQ